MEQIDFGSVFLGPKGENAEVFERLLLIALRDHVFWRRNVHHDDGFRVREIDKLQPRYQRAISVLSQELLGLLGRLKAGVPSFSPRYVGHMSADQTMASLIGYFATLLYNPNNVAAEVSPVTSQMELDVAAQLAQMVGFDSQRCWGHLTGGGTVANLEALWVARNVKYLPIAARWASEELGIDGISVTRPDGSLCELSELDLWGLLNLTPDRVLDLIGQICKEAGSEHGLAAIARNSLAQLGYQDHSRRLSAVFGDPLPAGVVLVPSTAHYSFGKICRVLGIGTAQLIRVPVDQRFRVDLRALETTIRQLAEAKRPIIACVGVIGSTEESAVDRFDRIVELRNRVARELRLAFYLHADAAFGGYAAAVTRAEGGERRSYAAACTDDTTHVWPESCVYDAFCALDQADSITIDPHKLGFIPYPAGSVLFRDARVRELTAADAPYLFHRGASEWGYIGQFILEGSKPGAAATAVWLSHKVLPLDASGYGRLIGDTCRGACALHTALACADWGPFRVVPLPRPDLNIVCFALGHPALTDLDQLNTFVERVYSAMSVHPGRDASGLDYCVTKTVLGVQEYGTAAIPIIEKLGFSAADYRRVGGLSVIRSTVMDPFFAAKREGIDYVQGFVHHLARVLEQSFDELTSRHAAVSE